jgi:hypothetical protein
LKVKLEEQKRFLARNHDYRIWKKELSQKKKDILNGNTSAIDITNENIPRAIPLPGNQLETNFSSLSRLVDIEKRISQLEKSYMASNAGMKLRESSQQSPNKSMKPNISSSAMGSNHKHNIRLSQSNGLNIRVINSLGSNLKVNNKKKNFGKIYLERSKAKKKRVDSTMGKKKRFFLTEILENDEQEIDEDP